MVCQRLGVRTLPKSVASFIAERAEGHPFHCEELAYALRDSQLIHVQNGVCQVSPDAGDLSRLNFPTTIEGVITSRIDRLSPQQQLVIKVSSVIGRLFAFNALQAIHPATATPANLRHHLGDLDRLDITQLQTPEPNLVYVFKHIITQEVAYNLLLFSQRRQLHRQVAEWYEHTHSNDLDDISPLLAYHWLNTLDVGNLDSALAVKALHYGEVAGDLAVRSYANQEAVRLFNSIKELASHLRDESLVPKIRQAHWELQLGEAYLGLGQLLESRQHFEQCLELLGWPVPSIGGKMSLSLLRQILWRVGWKRPFTPTPEQRLALQKAARAYELLGQIYYLTNLTVPTLYAMIRGLNLAEQVGEGTPELARAYANMSGAIAMVPLFKKSLAYEANAWETMSSLQDITTKTYLHLITTVHKINIANWDEAEQGFDKGLALANQLGDRRTAGFCISGRAHIFLYRGYLRDSMAWFEQLEALGEASHDVTHWGTALGGKGACHTRRGQWADALAHIDKSLTLSVEAGNALAEWNNRARLGLVQFFRGEMEAVLETAESTFTYAMQAPHTAFANTTIYTELLTTLLLLWEQSPQPHLPAKTATLCKRYKQYTRIFPFALPAYYRLNGWREWLNGRPTSAIKSWDQSLKEAQRLRMPYDEGMTHFEIGRHLSLTDPQRSHHLDEASRILTELEASHDLERLHQISESES
jgi:tetratricopeptide (TPR) repeat protein